jgi:tetratricopeptide (TPR) repeat protein
MLAGEKIDACRQCYQVENHGGYSLRQMSNRNEAAPVEALKPGITLMPSYIDLKLNNKCNLKCRMCQPRDSHLIYSEFKKIGEANPYFSRFSNTQLIDLDLGILLSEVPDWSTSAFFIEQFTKMLPHIRKVSIVGGEPLILNEVYDLLDLMIEKGFSKNIYIVFTTNLVHLPIDRLEKVLPYFEKTLFNISLDAVDEELYYLRYPTSFEKIKANFEALYNLDVGSSTLMLQFSPTVQVYNVLTLDKVYLYTESLLEQGYKLNGLTPVNLTFLEFPMHLNIRILPKKVKLAAVRKLEELKTKIPLLLSKLPVLDNLNQLIETLKNESINHHDYLPEFLYYSQILDQERGQKGEEAFPELFSYLKDISPQAPIESYHQIRERGWKLAGEGKYQAAIELFEESLKSSMNKDLDYREMAWMKRAMGLHAEALTLFEKAYQINPSDQHNLKGLAIQYSIAQNNRRLKEILPEALALNPDDKELVALAAAAGWNRI